ncbi:MULTISPECIES: helicase HerA-like domain-containing protein [Asticcacaulis]|uniref:helicase HerA-like domain-containing protein n=1 Tax=Asticcacaulis TaxID=76890 RepID=UPI001AE26FC3|nr:MULTISPECIES: helicase HerA-like domain-containing protein [Asticcacaulis]MBP2160923.1 DNA helicase HerA-like ATPase [Asticcacaulis solisilvae]MDR6801873.1 DNA helicase HerA-like ATPase [Asticcacaulis sp. BE141]
MADTGVFVGQAESGDKLPQVLLYSRANRHGLVAGATGTGKTVTLQVIAQEFSDAGVPVFAADIKGDLSGVALPGAPNEKLLARAEAMQLDLKPAAAPVIFWDLFGKKGHPIRSTISEMGPLLLARLLELNDTQEGVLNIVFHVADKQGLMLLDIADLRAMLNHVSENAKAISAEYGQVAPASIATIQRALLQLETQGADGFFGEPALKLSDLMRTTPDGRGYINVLAANQLIESPRLYSTFLLWLMSELFEELPEVGDPEKPRLVFFFDEAHLLFREASPALLQKIEQVVRLIRSKGVGIYFVTQNPADIPDSVLAQLGNRVQHALRAYTPAEQKGLKAAAQSFRPNPAFDTQTAIQDLGVGEALVSLLDEKGRPTITEKTLIRPPASRLGPANDAERAQVMASSPVGALYDTAVDRHSAYEVLTQRTVVTAAPEPEPEPEVEEDRETKAEERARLAEEKRRQRETERTTKQVTSVAVSVIRSVGVALGRELIRGMFGTVKRRR